MSPLGAARGPRTLKGYRTPFHLHGLHRREAQGVQFLAFLPAWRYAPLFPSSSSIAKLTLIAEDPAQVTTLLGHNVAVQSLTLRTNDSPGAYVNSWVPELLRSVVGRSLRDITFEMCLDREAALGERLWWDTTQIIQLHWLKTLSSVAFVHEPVQDEAMYHNGASFLLDGTLAFTRYFSRQLSRRGLVVGVRNAPILDLGVYKSNI